MLLKSMTDVNTVLSLCMSEGNALLSEADLAPEFFDLRTRIAGELFQKIMNYHCRVAIIVADPERYGQRFKELVHEHRRHNNIRFFPSADLARQWLELTENVKK